MPYFTNRGITPLPVVSGYAGPGDVAAGALGWWGFRAYSAAAIGQNAVRIARIDTPATQSDFVTLASGALDVASIATFLSGTTGRVVTLYDQTGHSLHITQTDNTLRPFYQPTAIGSLPGMSTTFDIQERLVSTTSVAAQAQPFTFSAVAKRTGNFGQNTSIMNISGDTSTIITAHFTSANTVGWYINGTSANVSQTDNVFHALQFWFNGTGASIICVDGSSTTGLNSHASTGIAADNAKAGVNFQNNGDMVWLEGGYWPSDLTANFTAMNSNQHTYWGF